MPIAPRAPPKAMRGKCERGHSFLTPGLQFHGVDRADVFNNIRVRASRCGECALNPPTSQPIPRRRPSLAPHSETPSPSTSDRPRSADARPPTSQHLPRRRPSPAPAQRHALPEHFRSPTQPRRTPAGCAMHARRPHDTFPVEDLRPPTSQHIPRRRSPPLPLRSASGTKKRHRTVDVRCRMSRSTVVAVGHWGW